MKYRIKEYKKGWIVEYMERSRFLLLFTRIKWVHATSWSGLKDHPYHYKTPEEARDGALKEIKDLINYSFYFG